ncbi:MAG: divalent-cation tolerance protein CutA [Pirellulales bacterium]
MMQVVTTVDSDTAAQQLAQQLVQQRLAACVQISGPITSVYRWHGAIESATEWRVVAKTTATAAEPLMQAIARLHPYQVPQIVAWPIPHVYAPYAQWVADSVGDEGLP